MIPALMENSLGQWLKSARLSSTDTTTGRPFTQQRVAELMHVSESKYAQLERGDILSLTAEDAHIVADLYGRDEEELVAAMGYRVGLGTLPLTEDERELLADYRRLRGSPADQRTARRVVRALYEPPPDQPQRRVRRSRPG